MNKGSIPVSKIFLIIVLILVFISIVFSVLPVFGGYTTNQCIISQTTVLRDLKREVEQVKESGARNPSFKFSILPCTECVWYDTAKQGFVTKISRNIIAGIPAQFLNYTIRMNTNNIGTDCTDCSGCANMISGRIYYFDITPDTITCTNCE
jgi:hypothetical protein